MKTVALAIVLLPALAGACINDRDTLAFETRNIDAMNRVGKQTDPIKRAAAIQELALRAIGGRFERYPDRYYQMRIDRLMKAGALTPAENDDLAVAYDRLGQVDKAIETILAGKGDRKSDDDLYRFHANYGTFLVHRWIVGGHRKEDVKTLEESIREIKAAIKINPNSHFGRENVQLALEESWLPGATFSSDYQRFRKIPDADLVLGLAGIAMMGLGYELPDVYRVMGSVRVPGQSSNSLLQAFANARLHDLRQSGKKDISPDQDKVPALTGEGKTEYDELIADGKEVHQARLAYMTERFDQGEHPDTHPSFWEDWEEPEYPVLNREPKSTAMMLLNQGPTILAAVAVGSLLVAALIYGGKRIRNRAR